MWTLTSEPTRIGGRELPDGVVRPLQALTIVSGRGQNSGCVTFTRLYKFDFSFVQLHLNEFDADFDT